MDLFRDLLVTGVGLCLGLMVLAVAYAILSGRAAK